jgi:hypothetical protein
VSAHRTNTRAYQHTYDRHTPTHPHMPLHAQIGAHTGAHEGTRARIAYLEGDTTGAVVRVAPQSLLQVDARCVPRPQLPKSQPVATKARVAAATEGEHAHTFIVDALVVMHEPFDVQRIRIVQVRPRQLTAIAPHAATPVPVPVSVSVSVCVGVGVSRRRRL